MADTTPAPAEKTVVVNNPSLCRLWTLTITSLTLSALILLLFVVGAIMHFHHGRPGPAGRDGRGGVDGCGAMSCQDRGQMGYGQRLHHFGGMGRGRGWGRSNGFGGNRDGGGRGPGDPSFGMRGMGGMMGMGKMSPPDPATMSDNILDRLSKKLSLTDDQKAKIKPIIEQQVADIQKQMEAQRAAMQKQIEDGKAKIRPLLTPDQQKQLDAMPLPGQKPPTPGGANQPAPAPGQ